MFNLNQLINQKAMNYSKKLAALLLMLFVGVAAFAQKSETRTPGSFTKIENNGSWDVYVTKGSKDEVRLESSNFDLSKVITKVENETLKIKLEKGNWNNVNLKVYVTVRNLESVGNGGSGDMILESDFGSNNFNIGLSGSGTITAKNITADRLNVGMSGSGKVIIAGGQADKATIGQSGSGDLEALDFTADVVDIGKSGSGNTSIGVTESLTVGSSGSGNVYYRGNPEKQSIGVSGSSRVVKK
ncbi:putative autotransporter adhesin-like protein [Algoriphagus boseongensis]|uniref:Putative autotransporter adhesin-like protein n=2 Tax=Algoriphagus boseongensis TaxID=1442587 RepID=A0A4R6TAK5_9BACT|nr:putative autotransporter adhesin-like protein [Algoriphagus boseongensis]